MQLSRRLAHPIHWEFRAERAGGFRGLSLDAPVSLDHLIETVAGTSSSEIIAALFELELSGLVRQLPGKSFLKVWTD